MNSPSELTSIPAERKGGRLRAACIVAAAIVAVIVLEFVGRHLYFRSKINAELDAVRKAGFPVTLQELSDYYPVPKGANAADVYSQAFAKYVDGPDDLPVVGDGKLPPRSEPLPKETQVAISAYLTSNVQALHLLHKAATMEGCRFDVDFAHFTADTETVDFEACVPHLNELRQATRLVLLDAVLRAEEDKPDKAVSAITDSFAVAHALQHEPLLVSYLVHLAMDLRALDSLERVLSRTAINDQSLAELSKLLVSEENPQSFVRAEVGERCIGEDIFAAGKWQGDNIYGKVLAGSDFLSKPYRLYYRISGMAAQSHLTYLRLMAKAVSVAGGTTKDLRERPPSIDREQMMYPLTHAIISNLSASCNIYLAFSGRLRAARAGTAVERFRVANGRLPDSLDELAPKWLDSVPTDPFDDKPIRYKKLTKGFVTYSIGPDLKDHGGKERDPTNSNAPYDITFIVAR